MEFIDLSIADHICTIALNRAAKYNAFNWTMLQELAEAYHIADNDREVRVVVVKSTGDHFTSGLDLADVTKHLQQNKSLFNADYPDPFRLYNEGISKPVLVAVRGYCFTIGIELMLAADYTVAHGDTTFSQMEVQRGIMPFGGATLRLPHRVGWGPAMKILLSGERFTAQHAHEVGLIEEIDQDPEGSVNKLATAIAAQAPLAVQAALKSAKIGYYQPEKAVAQMMEETYRLMASEDAKEGLQAFIERRSAKFTGR